MGSLTLFFNPIQSTMFPVYKAFFNEVARVIKPNGLYDLMLLNLYINGSWKDGCWGEGYTEKELLKGKEYLICHPYKDGYLIRTIDPNWNFTSSE